MRHLVGQDRCQTLLLPESLDDYVGPENRVRFIEAFVDGLDLAAAGFARVRPKETGRPGHAPTDLLKLCIYGCLNRVRSSRRLEAEAHRNLEVTWLLRHLKPDFKTIADFRRDNRKAFRPVFRRFVPLCRQLDLFGRELLAVDGTRIKAVNNKDRNFTRASLARFIELADARLDDYPQRLDQGGAADGTTGGSRVANLAERIAAVRERRALPGHAGRAGPHRRGPGLADRPRQPGDGGAHAGCGGPQRAGRGRRQAQADRGAAGHQPGR
jgi:transposase